MLDINFIRQNREQVAYSIKAKAYKDIDLDKIIELDDRRRDALKIVENLRKNRNEIANSIQGKPAAAQIEQGKQIKADLVKEEAILTSIISQLNEKVKQIPNIIFTDVPLGGEEDSVEIKTWGKKRQDGVDHLDYALERNWVDFERGAKVAGAKFYFLKNELTLLENALFQFGLKKVLEHGLTPISTPDLISCKVLEGVGFAPRSSEQSDEYFIEGEDLALSATAELPLTGFHMDEILDEKDLPLFYAGFSACFRKEAGSYGKHTRGLFRVHQFNKLEMYAFCLPEKSPEIHEKLLKIEEEIWQELNIPYRIINIAAGDLGAPAAKKYDIEYWSPVDQKYREITSCSNCTDFQARALNIRVRRQNGTVEPVHTLNGTAISLARAMVAVIENYAQPNGKLKIPTVLKPYLGDQEEL